VARKSFGIVVVKAPYRPNTQTMVSRGVSVVEFQQAAEPFSDADRAMTDRRSTRGERDDVAKPLMRALRAIVLDELGDDEPLGVRLGTAEAEPARKGGLSHDSPQVGDLCPDAGHRGFDIGHHVCGIEPKHMITAAHKSPIAPLIEPLACAVIKPIDLDDELHLGGEQIDDEPTEQGDLPPKRDPEPATAEGLEEYLLRSGRGAAHGCRALTELRASGMRNGRDVRHGILLVPSRGAGRERPRRTIRDVRQHAEARAASSMARSVRHEATSGALVRHPERALTARRETRRRMGAGRYSVRRAEHLAPGHFS
jgi:hypothetical protein